MVKPCANHVGKNLALKAGRLAVLYTEADAAGNTERRDTIRHRMNSIETEASWHKAGSPEAAFLQIGAARAIVDAMPESEDRETINRTFASLGALIEQQAGLTREAAGLEFYGTAEQDADLWI